MNNADFPLEFSDDTWQVRFEGYGWGSFDELWKLQADEVDEPNVRRQGWSSVVRMQAADGEQFYMKRQENHFYRDATNLYRQTPTAVREWRATHAFKALGVGVLSAVCLGVGKSNGVSRALLVTRALTQHKSLPDTLVDPTLTAEARMRLWHALGRVVRVIHDNGYRYNCLYGKHVMLMPVGEDWDIRMIDLEKATLVRSQEKATISDLSQLDRHTDDMSNRDRQDFWDTYFEQEPLSDREAILMKVSQRNAVKLVKQYIGDRRAQRKAGAHQ
jgi:hypothetical protein